MYSFLPFMYYLVYVCFLVTESQHVAQQLTLEELQQFDTSNVNESVIRSVLAQNVELDPNSTRGTRRCAACTIRDEQKRQRIESIKNKISHALKLDVLGLPNITDRRIPQVPSYQRLRERYELVSNANMQSDSPYSFRSLIDDEEDEFGRPERTYTFAKEVPAALEVNEPNAVFFDIPSLQRKEIHRALLWVYIHPSTPNIRVTNNITEIYIYEMVHPGKRGGPPVRNYIMRRKRRLSHTLGWHHFDITGIVSRWVNYPNRNLGVVVEALDVDGNNMIVLPPTSGQHEGFEPNLDVKTSTPLRQRTKRSTHLNCDEDNQVEACCRYPLIVDFVEFGWDFVIAPIRYAAYYCAGECQNEHMDNIPHARIVQETDQAQMNAPKAGPCCTPTRLSNLAMLYFDHQQSIQMTTLPKMKVERCGCQ